MVATTVLNQAAANLLAADALTLAAAGKVNVHLAQNDFTPSPEIVVAGLVEATFDGYAAMAVATATASVFQDSATGEWIIQLDEPAGGWHWQTTGNTNLPQTITGFWVTNPANTVVYGSERLEENIQLTGNPQGVDIPQVRFRFIAGAIS